LKTIKIVLVVLVVALLINFVRGGDHSHITEALPFCSGGEPSFYDFGATAMLVLLFWGLRRLKRLDRDE